MATLIAPPLPYTLDALQPEISSETMDYHYGKHLAAYFTNLGNLVAGTAFAAMTLQEIMLKAEPGGILNNAAQAWNHVFFFASLSPTPKDAPSGALKAAIERDFGSVEGFREQFTKTAAGLFGSGWTWLAMDGSGKLVIDAQPNAGNPLRKQLTPLLVVDVWEHAYYIDYRNRRADYLNAIWRRVDWKKIEERYNNK